MGRKVRGKGRTSSPVARPAPDTISREELQAMHGGVKAMSPQSGSEAFSLMCVLAACMDNWPRVRAEKVAEVRQRFQDLHRDTRNNNLARPAAQPAPARPTTPTPSERARQHTDRGEGAALKEFLAGLTDLHNDTPLVALPEGKPTGLTLGQLRRLRWLTPP